MKYVRRTLAAGAGAAGLLLAGATAAGAHVTANPAESPAGGFAVISFAVPHGCDGSPTTAIAIEIPEGVTSVKPTVVAGWDIEIAKEDLAEPIEGEGGTITDRVASITYTASEPLPDEYRQEFPVSMRMPEAPDETLAFPVVQTCVAGETAWITVPEEGQAEPEHPAPVVHLTEATGDGHGGGTSDDGATANGDTDETAANETTNDDDGDGDGTGLAIAALVVGGLGLAAGGVALARSRHSG
jgi:uncharacterized protein YcnI